MKLNINISGKICLIDSENLDLISSYNWYLHPRTGYVRGRPKGKGAAKSKFMAMHRLIMGLSFDDDLEIDHINGDRLDSRKQNLRICTHKNNLKNRRSDKNSSSKYLGVCWNKSKSKWQAGIGYDGKSKTLGLFEKEIDEAKAYDEAARIYHKEFANLNFK